MQFRGAETDGSGVNNPGGRGLQQAATYDQPVIPFGKSAMVKFLIEHPAITSRLGIGLDRAGTALQSPRIAALVRSLMLAQSGAEAQ